MTQMIEYITRFKTRYEGEIFKLEQQPHAQPAMQILQLTRARKILKAATELIAMGPGAMNIDIKKFETLRNAILSTNLEYCQTNRQIKRCVNPRAQLVMNYAKLATNNWRRR